MKSMQSCHDMIHKLHNPDVGSLLLRLAVGVVFIHAGWLKIHSMEMVISGFAAVGIPAYLAYFVSYAELVCGTLLVIGFLVRYAGILLAIIMAVALFKVHLASGFGLQNNGYEYVYVLLLNSIAIVTLGAGKYSLACKLKGGKK